MGDWFRLVPTHIAPTQDEINARLREMLAWLTWLSDDGRRLLPSEVLWPPVFIPGTLLKAKAIR